MSAPDVKEVVMDAPQEGGRRSRKRTGGGKRRKTRVAEEDSTVVTKDEHATKVSTPATAPAPASVHKSTIAPKVVIAPPKKKPVKVMLVPKGKTVPKLVKNKTFTAKSVKVTIDNTAKTRKNRTDALAKVDAMTEDQVRAAAVQARLSRRETVGKAPIGLLRQMVKDYQIMKGRLQ